MTAAAQRVIAVNGQPAGVLGRDGAGRFVFAYDRGCPPDCFVSLTMPVRLESYVWHELHPVFDGGLPWDDTRAALTERLVRAGCADPFALLDLCPFRLGRWHVLEPRQEPPLEPVADRTLMTASDARPAFAALLSAQYAWGEVVQAPLPGRIAVALDAHALYRGDRDSGAEAYNEWCALSIARRAGFDVPECRLSADGRVLRLDRWDGLGGARLGVEDLCGLQGLGPAGRYAATAERLVSVAAALAPPVNRTAIRRELFRRLTLGLLIGDTDRHLQTFAVVYGGVEDLRLAPLAGLRTDWNSAPDDPRAQSALSIGGQRALALRRGTLRRLGAHCALSDRESAAILDWLAAALSAERAALRLAAPPSAVDWLERLESHWEAGEARLRAAY